MLLAGDCRPPPGAERASPQQETAGRWESQAVSSAVKATELRHDQKSWQEPPEPRRTEPSTRAQPRELRAEAAASHAWTPHPETPELRRTEPSTRRQPRELQAEAAASHAWTPHPEPPEPRRTEPSTRRQPRELRAEAAASHSWTPPPDTPRQQRLLF